MSDGVRGEIERLTRELADAQRVNQGIITRQFQDNARLTRQLADARAALEEIGGAGYAHPRHAEIMQGEAVDRARAALARLDEESADD